MMAKSRGRCDSHESHRPLKLYGSKINHLQVVGIAFALSKKLLWQDVCDRISHPC